MRDQGFARGLAGVIERCSEAGAEAVPQARENALEVAGGFSRGDQDAGLLNRELVESPGEDFLGFGAALDRVDVFEDDGIGVGQVVTEREGIAAGEGFVEVLDELVTGDCADDVVGMLGEVFLLEQAGEVGLADAGGAMEIDERGSEIVVENGEELRSGEGEPIFREQAERRREGRRDSVRTRRPGGGHPVTTTRALILFTKIEGRIKSE